jgi:hypothetical protein
MPATVLAPGARVEIRSAEWIVRRVDATSTGGYSLLVTGVSEIVRDKEARFLTEIEGKGIKVLDPAETALVPDDSPQFEKPSSTWKACCANRLPPIPTSGSVTAPPLTTCHSNSTQPFKPSTSPGNASSWRIRPAWAKRSKSESC